MLNKKYSVTCAVFRMKACISARVSAPARGKIKCKAGRMKREVCSLENTSVERTEITHAQATAGSQFFARGGSRTIRPGNSALRE